MTSPGGSAVDCSTAFRTFGKAEPNGHRRTADALESQFSRYQPAIAILTKAFRWRILSPFYHSKKERL